MYLEVRSIGAEGLAVEHTLRMGPLEEAGGGTVEVAPVQVVGRVRRLRLGFQFRGRVRTVVTLACSRCLEPFRLELDLPFDRIYREEPEREKRAPPAEARGVPMLEDPAISHLEGGRICLRPLVAEQVTLAMPLKPLCRPECRGLCPHCGRRRDEDGCCGCQSPADPRLEALRDLKRRLEQG